MDVPVTVAALLIDGDSVSTVRQGVSQNVTCSALRITGGQLSANSSQIRVSGDWHVGAGDSLFVCGTSVVSFVTGGPLLRTVQCGDSPLNSVVIECGMAGADEDTIVLQDSLIALGSLTLAGGVLNLNGFDLRVDGNLSVDGVPGTLQGLGGVHMTVGDSATFCGVGCFLVELAPAETWYLSVVGPLTAESAAIANCDASGGSTGYASATSVDGGGNVNWEFEAVGVSPTATAAVSLRQQIAASWFDLRGRVMRTVSGPQAANGVWLLQYDTRQRATVVTLNRGPHRR
jgi:hypothetical protein